MNYIKDLRNKTNDSEIFWDTEEEWTLSHSFYEVNITSILKRAKTIQGENTYQFFLWKFTIKILTK